LTVSHYTGSVKAYMSEGIKLRPVRTSFHNVHDVPTFHAGNAWALDTTEQGIVLKFYVDCAMPPKETRQALQDDGKVSPQISMIPDTTKTENYEIIREFQCGVVLSKHAIRMIHELLGRVINQQDKLGK